MVGISIDTAGGFVAEDAFLFRGVRCGFISFLVVAGIGIGISPDLRLSAILSDMYESKCL